MAFRTELTLRLANSPGALADVCRALADERVKIDAMSLDAGGTLRMVVDNPVHAAGALRERHYKVDTKDVLYVIVPNDHVAAGRALALIAQAGINVDYSYAGSLDSDRMTGIVVGVEDPERASAAAGV
jgi:hypothetical protein